jgi:hypothetical protein
MLQGELGHRLEQLAGQMLGPPVPAQPKVYLPGVAGTSATGSCTLRTGSSRGTASTFGVKTICEIGARSFTGSSFIFANRIGGRNRGTDSEALRAAG